jgi:hypothetical protein
MAVTQAVAAGVQNTGGVPVYWLLVATAMASPEDIRALAQTVADDRAAALRSEDHQIHACVAARLATMLSLATIAEAAESERDEELGRRKADIAMGKARALAAQALGCPDPPPPRPKPIGWVEAGGAWQVADAGAALLSGGVGWRAFESEAAATWTPGRGWGHLGATWALGRSVAVGAVVEGMGRERWVWTPLARGVLGGEHWRVTVDAGVQWASDREALRPAGGVTGEGRLGPLTLEGGAALNQGWWLTEASTLSLGAGARWRVLPPLEIGTEVVWPVDLDTRKPRPVVLGGTLRWRI